MTLAPRDQQLYVIVWGSYVKVGCSADPIDRLARITDENRSGERPPRQRGLPELVGTVPGGFGAEAWLHAALAGHRAGGEWYHLRGAVCDLVDAAARTGLAELAPRPTRRRGGVVRMGPGDVLAAAVSSRGESIAERRRHALISRPERMGDLRTPELAGGSQRGLCGAGVRLAIGHFDPTHPRACPDCMRSLPR